MNLVTSHPAYPELRDNHVMDALVEQLEQIPNYSFKDFAELIPELAEDYAKEFARLPENSLMTQGDIEEKIRKTKGNIFEAFVMFALQYFETNSKIGVEKTSYRQIGDDEDCGLDFIGKLYSSGKRVFGQIKFRQDHPHNESFGRTEFNKLYGEAGDVYDFDKKTDCLMLVTNQTADNALKVRLREKLGGYVNNSFDFKHGYVKFVDGDTFQNMIDYNNRRFWEDFREAFSCAAAKPAPAAPAKQETPAAPAIPAAPAAAPIQQGMCEKYNVPKGAVLNFCKAGKGETAYDTVVLEDDMHVKYMESDMNTLDTVKAKMKALRTFSLKQDGGALTGSLSEIARYLAIKYFQYNVTVLDGPAYFMYNGKFLPEYRK